MSKKNRERREQNRQQQSAVGGQIAQENKSHWKLIIVLLVIIIAPIVTYWNSLEGEFHFDDYHFLIDNPGVRTLKGVFLDTPKILGTRFVSVFTLYLNYKLDGYNVFYYHLFNLGFHIINCILIYFVVLLLLRKVGIDKSYLAFLTSLFFALHPINTEPVNYILHGRFMTLCTMFYLGGFLSFILAFEPEHRKWLYLAISLLCWILSILSKEVGITLPGVLFFYYILFIAKDRKEIIKTSLFFASGIAFVILTIWIGSVVIKKTFIMESARSFFYGMPEILTELNVAIFCLSLYLLPLPSRLNVDHGVSFVPSNVGIGIDFRTAISILIIIGLIFWIIWTVKRNRLISFLLLWLFIAHLPTTFVRKGEMISEYRNYLPFFGFAFLAILCLSKIFSYSKLERRYTVISTLIISAFFVFADVERSKIWKNDLTLWDDSIAKIPTNPRSYYNRGVKKANLGDYKDAIEDFSKAIELKPDVLFISLPYSNRGSAKSMLGDYKGAIEDYNKAIELDPNDARAYDNRGAAKASLGDTKGGAEDCAKAVKMNPTYARGYSNLGKIKYMINDYRGAIENCEKAIELNYSYKEKLQPLINDAKAKINK